ncbi:hypothetical protein ACJMK2_023648 [Sinanodonta woodiana]|uniref:Uncharacterized protein n=1 Tax=Sinanodonta woodiana TaxID=1069815 RepID=A0ABD3T5H2_SINWO
MHASYAKAETCTQISDCNYESCTGNEWHIACEHGLCTCSHTAGGSTGCTSDSDCGTLHQCPFGLRWRCSSNDGLCHCRRN